MSRASALRRIEARDAAPLFAALGDATRLRLVMDLAASRDGPRSITALSADARVTRQAITKHLGVLSRAGLVRSTRKGRERVWDLEARRLAEAQHYLGRIERMWDQALGRLKAFVEEG